jgi:hypothetical protein
MDQFSPEQPSISAQEMEAVAAEVKRHQENPEHRTLTGEELVKKSIQTYTGAQPSAGAPSDDLPEYASNASPRVKEEVEHLLGLVLHKGILAANSEASRSNPFVLDAFHDALTGKLYPELQKRGIVD